MLNQGLSTALPNLHPAIIHFPIALVLTGLALRGVHLIRPGWKQADNTATLLTVLALPAAVAAWLAGRQAVSSLGPIPTVAEQTLSRHAELGGWTTIMLGMTAVISLVYIRRLPILSSMEHRLWRVGQFLVILGASALVLMTADEGGRLVYSHGVAITKGDSESSHPNSESTNATPKLGAVLISDDASNSIAIEPDGILVHAQGTGLVALPGFFDDVVVTANIDPREFQGRMALVHHAVTPGDWEGMLLDPVGRVSLVRWTGGKEDTLEETSVLFPADPVRLDVSASAGHFKGFLNGEMIIHGHGTSGPPGRVALYFSGTGTLKISEFAVDSNADNSHH